MSELVQRLATPFLPLEARYRLRQQRIDGESAVKASRFLNRAGVSVEVTGCVVGTGPSEKTADAIPGALGKHRDRSWFGDGKLYWDGRQLGVIGDMGRVLCWEAAKGGVLPDFAAHEVAEAGMRPMTSGECPATVVEFAKVQAEDYRGYKQRLYLLDEESRHLAALPGFGLADEKIAAVADAAGVVFRSYRVETGGLVSAEVMCEEILFPRSARRRRVILFRYEESEW